MNGDELGFQYAMQSIHGQLFTVVYYTIEPNSKAITESKRYTYTSISIR